MIARVVAAGGLAILALSFPLQASAARTMVIRLTSVTTSVKPHDVAPTGVSKGDNYLATSRLLNRVPQFGKPKGAVVGTDRGTLTILTKTTGKSAGVAKLPGGTIRFQGSGRLGTSSTIPVVGGTGDFKGAHGTLLVNQLGNTTYNTYRLTLPGKAKTKAGAG